TWPGGRPFVLAASAEDRPPRFSGPFTLTAPGLEGVTLTAAPPGEVVRVRVVTPAGQPAAGAAVRLHAGAEGAGYTAEQRLTRAYFEATQRMAFAGADGAVEFRGVPAGKVTIVASRPGVKPVRVEAMAVAGQASQLSLILP
ncbi:MAG: carboxypeptidase-like regulatory domain-containing protein, partial [Bryobacteraceae bacterium]|nr:carboxypeptidase-like regulatory domain-containing protein [Bryobacteraceae bacterium]